MGRREEVIFSSEESRGVQEIGDFLIMVGQKLKEQGYFTVHQGEKQIEIRPEGGTKLELKYEIERETKHGFEIEIEWDTAKGTAGKIDIS